MNLFNATKYGFSFTCSITFLVTSLIIIGFSSFILIEDDIFTGINFVWFL